MKLTKEQMRDAIERLFSSLSEGVDEGDMQDEFGMSLTEYEKLKNEMLEKKSEEIIKRPIEHTYVQYIIEQIRNINDLTEIVQRNKEGKNTTAAVSAIKARSEILDKIIDKGQSFGVIHKEADKKQISGGFLVEHLSTIELKKLITKELNNLNKAMKAYGDDINIIDVTPGAIHLGPENKQALLLEEHKEVIEEKPKSKFHKAKRKKLSKGRKGSFRIKPRVIE